MIKEFFYKIGEFADGYKANTKTGRTMPKVKIKRVYDKPLKRDGFRILVDRFWPRGVTKADAAIDEWAKELAPSNILRNWFDHDPYYWEQFRKKYKAELKQNKELNEFIERHRNRKVITLIYSTRYDNLTHALVLADFIKNIYNDT